jgi:GTPase SAR1 family protein
MEDLKKMAMKSMLGKKKIRVVISDTPGKDIMLTQNTLRKLAFVFLVFDVSNKATFDKVIEDIENYNEKNTVDTRVLYLLGNKTDKSPR